MSIAITHTRRGLLATAFTLGAAVAVVSTLLLGGTGAPRAAEAAPVPASQASCPAPVDPAPLTRNSDAFALIDSIAGESTNAQHRGEVALTAVRAGLVSGGTLCGSVGTRATFDPIVVEKQVDRSSVPLTGKALTGARIKTVRISLSTVGATPYAFLTYNLTDVRVVSIRQVKRGNTLTEEVAFDFARIAYTYVPQNNDGSLGASITYCWDIPTASSSC